MNIALSELVFLKFLTQIFKTIIIFYEYSIIWASIFKVLDTIFSRHLFFFMNVALSELVFF